MPIIFAVFDPLDYEVTRYASEHVRNISASQLLTGET